MAQSFFVNYRNPFLYCILLLTLFSCHKRQGVERAFYYWKPEFAISASLQQELVTLKVKTLYIRCFDVENKSGKPLPVAAIRFPSRPDTSYRVVPTVFIKNEVFRDEDSLGILADNILRKIKSCMSGIGPIGEYQVDCDWTQSTKANYFRFLKELKQKIAPAKLSVTIRLHQYKYAGSTGIPPADKGMLMAYNMSPLTDVASANSILDVPVLKKYLHAEKEYPLHLDVALPLFSWGVLFRGNTFKGLFNGLNTRTISRISFFKKEKNNQYLSTVDTVVDNFYFRRGDRIRIEQTDFSELEKAAGMISQILKNQEPAVAFFHLDSSLVNQNNHETINRIYNVFN